MRRICVRVERKSKTGISDDIVGKPTIAMEAGELCVRTEVFLVGSTIAATSAYRPKPRDTDSGADERWVGIRACFEYLPDDLMAEDNRPLRRREFAEVNMQISAAHAARLDTN